MNPASGIWRGNSRNPSRVQNDTAVPLHKRDPAKPTSRSETAANVMNTRDTQGIHDDREFENDADVYGALWTAAPFPRLPADAPNELKKLTIDIDDPKRVYAIHRASRRHNFHVLVERLARCLAVDLSCKVLTIFIDILFNSDTAVNPRYALHPHAFLVGDVSLGLHRYAVTMQRVRGH